MSTIEVDVSTIGDTFAQKVFEDGSAAGYEARLGLSWLKNKSHIGVVLYNGSVPLVCEEMILVLKRLAVLTALLIVADIACAQEYTQRLRSPAAVRGFIGGESHDSYVIRARKGQLLTVKISWRREREKDLGNNHAEFFVSELPNFEGEAVKFGKESNDGKRWRGRILRTGDYYIYVMAHPTAHYTLRVSVK